jgi:hypothetical protein
MARASARQVDNNQNLHVDISKVIYHHHLLNSFHHLLNSISSLNHRCLAHNQTFPPSNESQPTCCTITHPINLLTYTTEHTHTRLYAVLKECDIGVAVCSMAGFLSTTNTTRNTIIGYALSESVHLEPMLDHISVAVQYLNRC